MPRLLTRRNLLLALSLVAITCASLASYAYYRFSFTARFHRSKPALDAFAARVLATHPNDPLPPLPPTLGDFHPAHLERLPHGFLFFADYGHPLDANALAYSTEPLPTSPNNHDYFESLGDNWYTLLRN